MEKITKSIFNKIYKKENIINMLASEEVLKKDWNNKLDERWNKKIIFTI